MSTPVVSAFEHAAAVDDPRDFPVTTVLNTIRNGGKKLKLQITQIRNRYAAELAVTGGDRKAAKLAIASLKKKLPAVTWSGTFSRRANEALMEYIGLLCVDLDDLGAKLSLVREKLLGSPHVWALFLSPSGAGLKVIFRVPADAAKHLGSFLAVERHVLKLTSIQIDQSGKDLARLCFLSFDPDLYHNPDAIEIEPLPEPEKPARVQSAGETPSDLSLRERIATEELGPLRWWAEKGGFLCKCPGEHLHKLN
jgi:hypothetical protein